MDSYAISRQSVEQAAERIRGLSHRTPVLTCKALDAKASEGAEQELRLFFKVCPHCQLFSPMLGWMLTAMPV